MKVSVCLAIKNEEKSISPLLDSLLVQTKKPDEIVIVDGASEDRTVQIIRHYQKKNKRIKLLVEKVTRAGGRNLAVEVARNPIVAFTDGDCVAEKNWLKRITAPFKHKEVDPHHQKFGVGVDIVAGFYKMKQDTVFRKAEALFLGIMPSKFDISFLPSTRSIAFRKRIWERIGGFPDGPVNSAEDTDFNYKAVKLGARYSRVKNARVEWSIPESFKGLIVKFFNYSMWDVRYGIWWHPTQRYSSHNIKAILKFVRYGLGILILILAFGNPLLWLVLGLGLILYIFWAFRKVFLESKDILAGAWGVVLQFTSDFAVMAGFIVGLMTKK